MPLLDRAALGLEADALVAGSVSERSARMFSTGIDAFNDYCVTHIVNPLAPSNEDIVLFATELSCTRCVATVRVYLSAVRYHLLCKRVPVTCMQSVRLSAVLKGLERRQGPATTTRRGLTGQDLADLQHFLLRSNYSESDRAMIWASVLTAFHGLLRASEFLAPLATRVDSTRTLTWQQISVQVSSAVVRLRVTKTAQLGDGGQVQLRETRDDFCPVRALTAYLDLAGQREAMEPVFVFVFGRFLTREERNKILQLALRTNEVSCHSMRIGGASLMAQHGACEWQVKPAGRWRSSACEHYVQQAA